MGKNEILREKMRILSRSDLINDYTPSLELTCQRILRVLLQETGARSGSIIYFDPISHDSIVLAQKGKVDVELMRKAAIMRHVQQVKGKKLAFPISVRQKIFGVIELEGKNLGWEVVDYIQAAEMVLDGRMQLENESKSMVKIFEKYVDDKVIRKIMDHPDPHHISGERHVASILFADIDNFTQHCRRTKPESIINLLNEFYQRMAEIVFKYQGTVDKFIGDEIMAVFGTPLPLKNHAQQAVIAAQEMQKKIMPIVKKYKINRGDSGLAVGITTGMIVAGDVGYEKIMDYTVVGKKVNLAAKLCAMADANEIIVDESTKNGANKFKWERFNTENTRKYTKNKIFKLV